MIFFFSNHSASSLPELYEQCTLRGTLRIMEQQTEEAKKENTEGFVYLLFLCLKGLTKALKEKSTCMTIVLPTEPGISQNILLL